MSAQRAPDFAEPVVGYRAWRIDDDGLLRPWTFTAHAWAPGVNRAVCARDARHLPPVADCMCGLYALSDPSDRRLRFGEDRVVGAIAAWGDMEVHRTGFRAQEACVVALAVPDRAGVTEERRLRGAARRYGVALVPARELSREARRHGRPLPAEPAVAPAGAFARPHRADGPPAIDPARFTAPARGVALESHLWVETALGCAAIGLTSPLARAAGRDGRVVLAQPGAVLAAGDRLGTLEAGGGTLALWAPVSGRVLAVNPRIAADRGLPLRDPEGAGWLVRLSPTAWDREAPTVSWGRGAVREHAALLARAGDPLADMRLEWLRALPEVRSWSQVLCELRRRRAAPRFRGEREVASTLAKPLDEVLGADARLREHLLREAPVIEVALHDPPALLVIDAAAGGVRIAPSPVRADLRLRCSAETAYAWFTGALDVAGALRRGELGSDGSPARTLAAAALLKRLRIAGSPRAPSWEGARREP